MVTQTYLRDGLYFNAVKAMEEAGEFIKATCKSLNYGWHSVDPTLPEGAFKEENIDWVVRELEDTQLLLTRLHIEIINYKKEH